MTTSEGGSPDPGNAGDDETRSHESARVETDGGQSSGNEEGFAAVLEAAIERVTRALPVAPDELITDLVMERRVMRGELEELRHDGNVVPLRPSTVNRSRPRPSR